MTYENLEIFVRGKCRWCGAVVTAPPVPDQKRQVRDVVMTVGGRTHCVVFAHRSTDAVQASFKTPAASSNGRGRNPARYRNWSASLFVESDVNRLRRFLPETSKVFAAHGITLNGQRCLRSLEPRPDVRDRVMQDLFAILNRERSLHRRVPGFVDACPAGDDGDLSEPVLVPTPAPHEEPELVTA